MTGIDSSVTWHSKTTCTKCATPRRSQNCGVRGGHGSITKPFVSLERLVTTLLRWTGATIAPKVVEILPSSYNCDEQKTTNMKGSKQQKN